MKNFIITSAVCIAMILSSASSMAQQITIVSGKVLNLPEGEKKPRPFPMGETVRIFAFNTVASARDALKALETGGGGTLLFDADAVAGADGYYEIRVAENGALIFNVQMKNELREVNYKQEINANIDGGIALEEVEVVAENPNPQPRPVAGKIVGNKLIVNNSVAIPSNYGAPNRRLIMQPYIMDCTTEEIVSYMDPTVMDGPEYGLTQDRRMAYDIKNDKLALHQYPSPAGCHALQSGHQRLSARARPQTHLQCIVQSYYSRLYPPYIRSGMENDYLQNKTPVAVSGVLVPRF